MKISIITANHNCGKFLQDCINSVVQQNYVDYEHIIIDDCSTDKSYRILEKNAAKYPHIKLLRSSKRMFCGGAYNMVAGHASGDIVGVLDADDALSLSAMQNIVAIYKANPDVAWIWTQFWFCTDRMKKITHGVSEYPGNMSLLDAGVLRKHCFSHWRTYRNSINDGTIFKKSLKSAVDKYMGYRLEELGVGGFVNIPLYYYRKRIGGLSYKGRQNWKMMKKEFVEKRQKEGIKPYPIKILSHEYIPWKKLT